MKLNHPPLEKLLRQAYSAERAASFAYQGHTASLSCAREKTEVFQIEMDEWHHRKVVKEIMDKYGISVSKFYEIRFFVIGKLISYSCYIIGRFMPFYFAGRLESGNVCEYFVMKQYFNSLGIHEHDEVLYEMGIKEKEHEVYFAEKVKNSKLLPFFERFFNWSAERSFNNIDLAEKMPVDESDGYCRK